MLEQVQSKADAMLNMHVELISLHPNDSAPH